MVTDYSMDIEYRNVIRIGASVQGGNGYVYLAADKRHTLDTQQYARDMTLARGRILYEVWDYYRNIFCGYFVPHQIYNEALANREGGSLGYWDDFPSHKRNAHIDAYRLIRDRFPRIPLVSAKIVAETINLKDRRVTGDSVEKAVVEYVQYCWTSFELRIMATGTREKDAYDAIRARMRDVLVTWLPDMMGSRLLVRFWEKHELLDDHLKGMTGGYSRELFHTAGRIQWFGGAELPSNLISETYAGA